MFLRFCILVVSVGLYGYTLASAPTPAFSAATAQRRAQIALGKLLFFDPVLSANGKRSCVSCHRPDKAFTDQRITPRAFRLTANLPRNAPTLLNAGAQARFFHDGRAASLAAVTASVLTHPLEFNSSYDTAIARLQTSLTYDSLFRTAYHEGPTEGTLNAALAAYVGSLTATNSPYDRARAGGPRLPAVARRGQALFLGPAGCARCHHGPHFRDGRRHAVAPQDRRQTPTLRNCAVTAPYLADGSAPTLLAVLTTGFHDAVNTRRLAPAEVDALIAFLETLTDTTSADHTWPAQLPPVPHWAARQPGGQY